MYGLGGKLFSREGDIETAKKLTNGCVWAYQSTLSGIMPEAEHVVPCSSLERCEFNKTRWYEALDPSKRLRDQELRQWEAKQGKKKAGRATHGAAETSDGGAGNPSRQGSHVPGVLDRRAVVPASAKNKEGGSTKTKTNHSCRCRSGRRWVRVLGRPSPPKAPRSTLWRTHRQPRTAARPPRTVRTTRSDMADWRWRLAAQTRTSPSLTRSSSGKSSRVSGFLRDSWTCRGRRISYGTSGSPPIRLVSRGFCPFPPTWRGLG